MMNGARHPAYRRYTLRLFGAAVVYLITIFAAARILHHNAPASPLSIGIALVPGLAAVGMIWAIFRLLVELDDEYLRMLEVRKIIFATGVMLVVSSVWGLLEIYTDLPALPVFWMFPIWAVGLSLGTLWNKLTLGDGGCA